jgi:mannose-6-phosphate isomerase-like protein (cupin superfamily)
MQPLPKIKPQWLCWGPAHEHGAKEVVCMCRVLQRPSKWRNWKLSVAIVCLASAFVADHSALGQFQYKPGPPCEPVSQRKDGIGCWITAQEHLGQLPQVTLFWHIDTYPGRASAEAAKGPRGTVVESYGKVWLFTIAEAGWRPSSGERVAEIGPLVPINLPVKYIAHYMEATFEPGMETAPHHHPGPEAWYTLSGEVCLETPNGKVVGRAGEGTVVPGGPPMRLTATGAETRRSLVLVLHDASQPWGAINHDWTPKGLCRN